MRRLTEDADNLRAALDRLLSADPDRAVQLAGALGWWWQSVSATEGSAWLTRALNLETTPDAHRSRAADWAWWLAIRSLDFRLAEARLREGHQISMSSAGIARALTGLAPVARLMGRREESSRMISEALALAETAGDMRMSGAALTTLGVFAYDDRNVASTVSFQQAIEVQRGSANIASMSMISLFLGASLHRDGDQQRAATFLDEALDGFESLADVAGIAMALEYLAVVAEHLDLSSRVRLSAAGQAIQGREGTKAPAPGHGPRRVAFIGEGREGSPVGRHMEKGHQDDYARSGRRCPRSATRGRLESQPG